MHINGFGTISTMNGHVKLCPLWIEIAINKRFTGNSVRKRVLLNLIDTQYRLRHSNQWNPAMEWVRSLLTRYESVVAFEGMFLVFWRVKIHTIFGACTNHLKGEKIFRRNEVPISQFPWYSSYWLTHYSQNIWCKLSPLFCGERSMSNLEAFLIRYNF